MELWNRKCDDNGCYCSGCPSNVAAEKTFTDLEKGSTPYDSVMSLMSRGVIDGFTDGSFRPGADVTRGQAAKFIVEILDLNTTYIVDPEFKDVPKSHRFYKYIAALANEGFISGYKDGNYGVNDGLKRSQMAKILTDAYDFGERQLRNHSFTDVNPNAYYAPYLQALIDNKITYGKTKTSFAPDELVNRGQMAMFLFRGDEAKFGIYMNATVMGVENGKVFTTAGNYEPSGMLERLFMNEDAFKDSKMIFRVNDKKVSAVEAFEINHSGTTHGPAIFSGQNGLIHKQVVVRGDNVTIDHLHVKDSLIIQEIPTGIQEMRQRKV